MEHRNFQDTSFYLLIIHQAYFYCTSKEPGYVRLLVTKLKQTSHFGFRGMDMEHKKVAECSGRKDKQAML